MKSRADWGNRQGNSERCFLYFLNEINDLVCHFESHQPPHPKPLNFNGFFASIGFTCATDCRGS